MHLYHSTDGMCYADRDNLRQLISDLVERRRASLSSKDSSGDTTATGKNVKDMIDAALALNLAQDVMIADLLSFFIGAFHTSAACELSLLLMLCRNIITLLRLQCIWIESGTHNK